MTVYSDILDLQYQIFRQASSVARARGLDHWTNPLTKASSAGRGLELVDPVNTIRAYAEGLSNDALKALQLKLARAYLAALDHRLSKSLASKRSANDGRIIRDHLLDVPDREARVALVSMPWTTPSMPSIQLATLAAALEGQGTVSDRYEFFVDYASTIGVELYKIIGNTLPFIAEWIFSRHYFGPEQDNYLREFPAIHPRSEFFSGDIERQVMDVLGPITANFLDEALCSVDWTRYTLVGVSVSISQLGASLALSRLIKKASPKTTIVFGGSSCAGVMGRAMMNVCPYIDAVVHVEGEEVLPEILRRLDTGTQLDGIPGVTTRSQEAQVTYNPHRDLYRGRQLRPPLDYTPYFSRLCRTGLAERLQVWVPFEGSRGCWWGERAQCTFCGLHEIMAFRGWKSQDVLRELDYLRARHGLTRFFAVDLILPQEFHMELLPALANRPEKWTIFYEVKASMTRAEVQGLADAGVVWVQPGVETLDRDLLKLIKKGTTPAQNIQLLRWCQQYGIRASWNLLTGIPGSRPEMYERMAARFSLLFHVVAPRGCGNVQLHRFSPYFNRPDAYGVTYKGPHHLYRAIFPIDEVDLANLVYLHEWEHDDQQALSKCTTDIQSVVRDWTLANERGAALDFLEHAHGCASIVDTRTSEQPVRTELTRLETKLYRYLDTARLRRTLAKEFQAICHRQCRSDVDDLEVAEWIDQTLRRWEEQGLIFVDGPHVLALAIDRRMRLKHVEGGDEIPYL